MLIAFWRMEFHSDLLAISAYWHIKACPQVYVHWVEHYVSPVFHVGDEVLASAMAAAAVLFPASVAEIK